jgi:RNA-directed DNA polymerase
MSDFRLRHYHYRILNKVSGSIRLIEAPKPRLKRLQRQILTEILEKIPSHPAVHGFRKGRSIKTFTAPHTGKRVVLRMDLQNFFPSFAATRIQSFFRTAGYPELVADLLGGVCTTATPRDIWSRAAFGEDPLHLWESCAEVRASYSGRHLPQGAPTSPALANLCAYRLDCRLAGLAESAGAVYTRYADDLAFSGATDFDKKVERFSAHIAAIAVEEGFKVHHRKTRIMRHGVRQHLAGLVVNQHMNVRRSDFDRLKAALTNCVRFGPESQNRESHPQFRLHLKGRIGFVEMINLSKGRRLRDIFERIQWT